MAFEDWQRQNEEVPGFETWQAENAVTATKERQYIPVYRGPQGAYPRLGALLNKEIEAEEMLPLEERYQLGKIVGLAEKPQELKDELANTLYFSVELDAPPRTIDAALSAIIKARWPNEKLSQGDVRNRLSEEYAANRRDWYGTQLEPLSLFGNAFLQSLGGKPAMALRGAKAYIPGKTTIDQLLQKTSDYLVSFQSKEARARVEKAAAGRLWPKYIGRPWYKIDAELLPETINAWAAIVGDQIPIMLMTVAGRAVGKVVGKPIGTLAGGAYAMATAGPDPHDVGAAPIIAKATHTVIEHLSGAAPLIAMEAGAFLDRANAIGLDDDIGEKYARLYGLGSGTIEYAQWLWNLKAFKTFTAPMAKSITKRVLLELGGNVWEGFEELTQGGLENYLIGKAIEEQKLRTPTYDMEKPETWAEGRRQFAIGAVVSAIVRAPGHAYTGLRRQRIARQIQDQTDATRKEATLAADAIAEGGQIGETVRTVVTEQVKKKVPEVKALAEEAIVKPEKPAVAITKPTLAVVAPAEAKLGMTTIETSIGTIEIPTEELDVKWDEALEVIFDYGNQTAAGKPIQPDLSRSLSMGDTVKYEGKTWLAMPTGWQDVSQFTQEEIDTLVGEAKIPIPPKARPPAEAKPAEKEPWEMSHREFYDIAGSEYTAVEKFGLTAIPKKLPTTPQIPLNPDTGHPYRGATPEERIHKAVIHKAIRAGKPVPRHVLEEYKSEKWAQEALARPAAEAKPAKPKGIFGQLIFEPITGKQLDLGLAEIEKRPEALREVEIKPELQREVANLLDKDERRQTLQYKKPEDLLKDIDLSLFNNPSLPMPEIRTAWNQAKLGMTFLPKTTVEIGLKEAAVIETGISDKQRTKHIRQIEKKIQEHPLYQNILEKQDVRAREVDVGVYYVPKNLRGEVKDAIANHPALKFHITHDPNKGIDWTQAVQEGLLARTAGTWGEMDISEFLERIGQVIAAKRRTGRLLEVALEEALAEGNAELQILDDIRYGLKTGKPVAEINANTREWAEHYKLTEQDISDILISELSDEEIKAEREKARAEDEALEELEAARLRETEKKTAAEQERLKEIIARQEAAALKKKTIQARITKLRHDIHAVAAKKGLTKKALTELKKKHTGYAALTGKRAAKHITVEQLESLLKAVHKTRPKRIGYKRVITQKTERKVQSLKESLVVKTQMTDADFAEILNKEAQGKQPRYISGAEFITETQGKDIIKRMLDEAHIIGVTEGYEQAIRKNEEIYNQVRILDQRIDRKPKRDPYSLDSMRYYNQQAEVKTGEPFYNMYMDLIDAHLDSIKTRTARLKQLENALGKEQFRAITRDENALQRVSDYIAAQSTLKDRPSVPKNITDNEVKLAKKIQAIAKEYRLKARFAKFYLWWETGRQEGPHPLADYERYTREINKAADILEGRGLEPLIEYLKTQEWGIIKSGYEPLEHITHRIKTYPIKSTTLGKGHIEIRTDIEYHTQERNILQRLASYMRQIDMLYNMGPKISAFVRLYDDNMAQFKNPSIVKENIETFIRNLKRYNIQGGFFERLLARLYSQAMRVIIMPSPTLAFRNLFQNAAFEHDKSILIDPTNKPLSKERVEFLETYVLQTRAMVEEYFMVAEKPLPGLKFLTAMIDKIKLYPHSDITNRHWSFWAKINQVDSALENDNIAEMMKAARFEDITELEQRRALGILAKDGKEAMARYVARVHVDDIHFLYERSQRSPAEMTPLGRVVGNLFLFPRAYGEKLAHAANKALKGQTTQEQWRGLKILFSVIGGGLLVGAMYRKITGRKRNPYDPLEILSYEAGGLAWGAVESANTIYADMLLALSGDERALAALTTAIPEAADMFIPFYDYTLRGYEALTDQKNVDRKALREIRMMIDKEYKIRGGAYKVRRNALQKWQYFIAGAGVDEQITTTVAKPIKRR